MEEPTVGSAIADLVEATPPGPERRELRAALSHVDAELGGIPLRDISRRRIDALMDELRGEGLSEEREQTILEAIDELLAFSRPRPPAEPGQTEPQAAPAPRGTPTATMLALGAHLATWATVGIMIAFVLLLVVLLVELA